MIDVSKVAEHLEIRCKQCEALIAQCKCAHESKVVKYSVCDTCKYGN